MTKLPSPNSESAETPSSEASGASFLVLEDSPPRRDPPVPVDRPVTRSSTQDEGPPAAATLRVTTVFEEEEESDDEAADEALETVELDSQTLSPASWQNTLLRTHS